MAKKFFYNRVYNTRRTIINVIIIGVCVIGIVVCFIITSNFQGKDITTPEKSLNIKNEVIVEVNQDFSKDIFFSKIENVNLDEIQINYDNDYNIARPGRYNVTITVSGKNYNSSLVVVDTLKPELLTKDVTINEYEYYNANDFVSRCTDNSNENCIIAFYTEGLDEDGNSVNYSKYTKPGTYTIKIVAKDSSENINVQEAKLTIKSQSATQPETPTTCKYGTDEYDKTDYLATVIVASNHCAISLDLYLNPTTMEEFNKVMDAETTRITKDIGALNLSGSLSLDRHIRTIINKKGLGVVGYELTMTVTITDHGESEKIVEYKLDNKGNRIYTVNKYNLK